MRTDDVGNNKHVEGCENFEEQCPTLWQNLKQYVWEYCNRSTIHGVGYLGERRRLMPERIWWIVCIQVACGLCLSLTMKTYQKWRTSPAVTIATTQVPNWQIPFPAVTICPEVKMKRERFSLTNTFKKKKKNNSIELTATEELEYQYMLSVCYNSFALFDWNLTIFNESVIDFLIEVAPDYTSIINGFWWMGSKNLSNFSPILTNEGICYTFNGLDKSELFTDVVTIHKKLFSTNGIRSNWSLESRYSNAGTNSYPERIYTTGNDGGLALDLPIFRKDIDYACGNSIQGFKVILHNPEEVPLYIGTYIRVPLKHWVAVAVKPSMMTTSDDLKDYDPAERECYYSKEKQLKYFKVYNQVNCINECLFDFILEKCGCVGFYMPRQNSTPICSSSKYQKCVIATQIFYIKKEVDIEIKLSKKSANSSKKRCDCLPSCSSLNFDYELSQAQWNLDEYYQIFYSDDLEEKQKYENDMYMSHLRVFFKDMQFIQSERNELYGKVEFLANCGGLLGLFLGFSFISAMEILYYLTLRLVCNLYKFGRSYWSGTEEILETMRRTKKNESSF